jgi:hypothetical protein
MNGAIGQENISNDGGTGGMVRVSRIGWMRRRQPAVNTDCITAGRRNSGTG